jgi:hypothetical protein
MGFPHDKATHHFRRMTDGGAIEVVANDPKDSANAEVIRSHLRHIVMMFGDDDFSAPIFTHDGVPPGVTTIKNVGYFVTQRIFSQEVLVGRRKDTYDLLAYPALSQHVPGS